MNAVHASVEQNLSDVVRLSSVLAELGRSGKVTFVGAFYDLESGKVRFSEPVVVPAEHAAAHAATKEEHR